VVALGDPVPAALCKYFRPSRRAQTLEVAGRKPFGKFFHRTGLEVATRIQRELEMRGNAGNQERCIGGYRFENDQCEAFHVGWVHKQGGVCIERAHQRGRQGPCEDDVR